MDQVLVSVTDGPTVSQQCYTWSGQKQDVAAFMLGTMRERPSLDKGTVDSIIAVLETRFWGSMSPEAFEIIFTHATTFRVLLGLVLGCNRKCRSNESVPA